MSKEITLLKNIKEEQLFINEDYVYFIGKINIAGITDNVLCRQKIITKKQYILNKNKNLITDSEEIFQKYLQKKEGIRGYKTIKIGIIEKYPQKDLIECKIPGADGKYCWWTDRDNKISISNVIKNHIWNHTRVLTSDFIPY